MDCITAREWMATEVAEDLEPAETLGAHLSGCPKCRAEYEEWRHTWVLLTSWADVEPPPRLDPVILAEVRARAETSPSWFRRLASGRVWAAAAGAAVLAVMVSLLLPLWEGVHWCGPRGSGCTPLFPRRCHIRLAARPGGRSPLDAPEARRPGDARHYSWTSLCGHYGAVYLVHVHKL